MITEEQRLIILKALRDSYANLTDVNMSEKEFANLTNAMAIVKNANKTQAVKQNEEQLVCSKCSGRGFIRGGATEILPCLTCFGSGEKVD